MYKYRRVEVFHKLLETDHKEAIVRHFADQSMPLKLVVATVAFGMGIDCSSVENIIHYGSPESAKFYIQETGRAGRKGQQAKAILFKRSKQRTPIHRQMTLYMDSNECRRHFLFRDYDNYEQNALLVPTCAAIIVDEFVVMATNHL